MILAAGLGTRLRPVTEKLAKPAVPFLNIPLLYYPLELLTGLGIDKLVINTHHRPEQIEQAAKHSLFGAPIALSYEPGQPLGSGGGIWGARGELRGGGDFVVCNGDEVILPRDPGVIARFASEHRKHKALATILVMEHPLVGTQFGGVWTDAGGDVKGFGKDPKAFGPGLKGYHYIGLLLLNDRVFDYLPEGESNILYDALKAAIDAGETVRACVGEFTWFETGNLKDFLEASESALRLLENGRGNDATFLKALCQKHWSPGSKIERHGGASVLKGAGARIAGDARVQEFAVLGDGAEIGANAEARRCVLLPRARIASGAKADAIVLPD